MFTQCTRLDDICLQLEQRHFDKQDIKSTFGGIFGSPKKYNLAFKLGVYGNLHILSVLKNEESKSGVIIPDLSAKKAQGFEVKRKYENGCWAFYSIDEWCKVGNLAIVDGIPTVFDFRYSTKKSRLVDTPERRAKIENCLQLSFGTEEVAYVLAMPSNVYEFRKISQKELVTEGGYHIRLPFASRGFLKYLVMGNRAVQPRIKNQKRRGKRIYRPRFPQSNCG